MNSLFPHFVLLITMTLFSCSHFSPSQTEEEEKIPEWVFSPSRSEKFNCIKTYLCAVGEGSSLSAAQAQARAELAKIFRVEVDVRLKQTLSSSQGDLQQSDSQTIRESFLRELEELTHEVLEGVEVAKGHRDGGDYYALAILDKAQARRRFLSQVETKDQELIRLVSLGGRNALFEARNLWLEREQIHLRTQVLSLYRDPPVALVDIDNKIDQLPVTKVAMSWPKQKSEELKDLIAGQLHRLKHSLVPASDGVATQKVEVYWDWRELQFNVENFQRFQFRLKLLSKLNDQSLGSIDLSLNETGRNFDQAIEKAIPQIREYVESRIHQLNLN